MLPASQAAAQYSVIPDVLGSMISNMAAAKAERECLIGLKPPAPEKVEEARTAAEVLMKRYVAAAGATDALDATPYFTRKKSLRFWGRNGAKGRLEAADDPLAHAVAGGASVTSGDFFRASDLKTAIGLWTVNAADGAIVGRYRGQFRAEGDSWILTRLDVVDGAQELGFVSPFCHIPGDIDAFKTNVAKMQADQARNATAK
jgi:hypothetical protein